MSALITFGTPGNPSIAGIGEILRQGLRRDRVIVSASVALFTLMAYASAFATGSMYRSTPDQLKAVALVNGQPGILALYGPIDPDAGVGALAMSKMTVLYALFAAGVFVALVRRHTRVEEESGRAELLGGTAMGRHVPLAAAVLEAVGVAVILGGLCAAAAVLGGLPARGSLYFGLSWVGTGLVATGVAAVCCQLFASARTCASMAAGVLGVMFVTRAVGDSTSLHWLDWFSPLGWNTELHAWSQPRTWVLVFYVALSAGLLLTAQWLRSRRDLDAGAFSSRPGPAVGARSLRGPASLELRLHRTMGVVWSVVTFSACAFFGSIIPALNDVLKTVGGDKLKADLGGSLIVAILSEFAVIVSCFAVVVVTHASAEERDHRAEMVLTAPQSRTRWFGSVVGLASGGTAWLMLLAGLGMWLGDSVSGGVDSVGALWGALVWIPAILIIVGLSLAVMAARPSWAPSAWVFPLGFWLLSLVPPLLHAPGWVASLSPYSHVPKVPTNSMQWAPEVSMSLIGVCLIAAGFARFTARDLD